MFFIGQGFDVHPLVSGRKLILGGVEIPFEKGLSGHSDADVLIHSLCDAILGAIGEEDIGYHFPDTSLEFKDISSLLLLDRVVELVKKKNLNIINADITIIAQEPKIRPFIPEMKKNLLQHLSSKTQLNIKATTTEHLGFIGRGEGIAAMSVVLVSLNDNLKR